MFDTSGFDLSRFRTPEARADQARREETARAQALIRFRAAMLKSETGGRASETGPGAAAVRGYLTPLTEAIEWACREKRALPSYGADLSPQGRPPAYLDLLAQLPANVVALLTLKAAVDTALRQKGTVSAAASELGAALETEAMVREFARLEGRFIAECADGFKRRGLSDAKASEQLLIQMREKASAEWSAWDRRARRTLALDLVSAAVACSQLFALDLQTEVAPQGSKLRVKRALELRLSAAGLEWWAKASKNVELHLYDPLPMVCVPIPWTGAWGGGYVSPETPIAPLVKTRDRDYLRALKDADLTDVLSALNAIQETPWRINRFVYDTAYRLWQDNGNVAGLPPRSIPDALPPRCPEGAPEEAIKARNKEARLVYLEQTRIRSRAWRVDRALTIAADLLNEDAIFFPYQLDFRGRIYPMVSVLSPQGTDFEKGLLEFSEGKALGSEEAACWLAIHGANSYGKDKLPMQERVQWVQDNEAMIVACGESVSAAAGLVDWWGQADKPFAFLAFCAEWARFVRHCETSPGDTFVSRLPVSLDGTCNGLQHLSAMTRDEVGGAFVNLTNHAKPADIYARVAERVLMRLQEIAIADESEQRRAQAQGWIAFGIDRKITKRVVMVVPYGGTQKSCREYVRAAVSDLMDAGRPCAFKRGRELLDASTMLSGVVWESLADVLVGARRTMKWLQKAARLLAAEGKPVRWTTPSGFPVLMAYRDTRAVELRYGPRREAFRAVMREPLSTYNPNEQANGISPNYTHSLDATHLTITVNTAAEYGVTAWAAVHDSYGTHAADVPVLTQALRKAFAYLYEGDPLAALEAELRGQLADPDKLPPRPAYGSWQPAAVLEADFFFH